MPGKINRGKFNKDKFAEKKFKIAALAAIIFAVGTSIIGSDVLARSAARMLPEGNLSDGIVGVFGSISVLSGKERPVVLIDAGHGGLDGGASSADGVSEKDINLNISLFVRDILEGYDIDVEMTREEDKGLYTGVKNDGTDQAEIEGKRSWRSLKAEDLNARRDMADSLDADAFVSIHLNSYKENKSVFGAQTFYTTSCSDEVGERSKNLAENIQKFLLEDIDNGNTRTALKKNDVLIMKNASCPTVIVECGFLSNPSEAGQLRSEEYQKVVANSVSKGILAYLGIEEKKAGDAEGGVSGLKIVTSDE